MDNKRTYIFEGVECMIGRGDSERVLHHGDSIELSDVEYFDACQGGAALVAARPIPVTRTSEEE